MKKIILLLLISISIVCAQSDVARVGKSNTFTTGTQDFSGVTHTLPVIKVATTGALPGTCSDAELAYVTAATAGSQLYSCKSNAWTQVLSAASNVIHKATFLFSSGTLATGDLGLFPGNGAETGTINRVDVSGAASGGGTCSATVDIWKRNAAIPTSANKISASAPATLSSANLSQSGSLTGWTTSVAANDVWSATLVTLTSCITVLVEVYFQ